MRGEERRQRAMLMVMEPGDRVPKEHPLRRVKELADAALGQLSPLFDAMYSVIGRPSLPPERLLKASLLMGLYTVRSERMFCEQLDYNLLFRWFLDMDVAEPSFDHSTFSRNRARLLEHDVAREFFTRVVAQARGLQLLADEHFTVDGTLVEAWASLKSFKRKIKIGHGFQPNQMGRLRPGNAWTMSHGRCGGINGVCEESRREALVVMVHTTDLGDGDDFSDLGHLYRPLLRAVLVQ